MCDVEGHHEIGLRRTAAAAFAMPALVQTYLSCVDECFDEAAAEKPSWEQACLRDAVPGSSTRGAMHSIFPLFNHSEQSTICTATTLASSLEDASIDLVGHGAHRCSSLFFPCHAHNLVRATVHSTYKYAVIYEAPFGIACTNCRCSSKKWY